MFRLAYYHTIFAVCSVYVHLLHGIARWSPAIAKCAAYCQNTQCNGCFLLIRSNYFYVFVIELMYVYYNQYLH